MIKIKRKFYKYSLPKRKMNLLTKDLLEDFKEELSSKYDIDYDTLVLLSDTFGIYEIFKKVSYKYNITNAICNKYENNVDVDIVCDVINKMLELGLIEEKDCDDYIDLNSINVVNFEIVYPHNGYNTVEKDYNVILVGETTEQVKEDILKFYSNDDCYIRFNINK